MFVVSENEAEFSVHATIIAKQSKALDVLINGSMGEAIAGKVIFGDVEEETFTRFCQFAYTGNYTTPKFTRISTSNLPDVLSPVVIPTGITIAQTRSNTNWPVFRFKPPDPVPVDVRGDVKSNEPKLQKKPSKTTLRVMMYDTLKNKTEPLRTSTAARCEIRQNSDPTEDYTLVFLGHAQLYVFAEKWGIEALKNLCLLKLHQTLTTFTPYPNRRLDTS